jgi:hypothetical protein
MSISNLGESVIKKFLVTFAFSMLATANSHASVVTYSFSGNLYDIRESGAHLPFGATFSGTYQYDDSSSVGVLIESGRVVYPTGGFSVSAGGKSFVATGGYELQVFNDYTSAYSGYFEDDGFFVSSWSYGATTSYLLQFDMWDFSGSTLSNLDKPSQDQILQLAHNGRVWIREFDNGVETGLAGGYFQSFNPEPENTVPEPPVTSLVLAGLLGLWQRRSKR